MTDIIGNNYVAGEKSLGNTPGGVKSGLVGDPNPEICYFCFNHPVLQATGAGELRPVSCPRCGQVEYLFKFAGGRSTSSRSPAAREI